MRGLPPRGGQTIIEKSRATAAPLPRRAPIPDTLVASAKAYLGALNKLMIKRQRGVRESVVAERRVHSTDAG